MHQPCFSQLLVAAQYSLEEVLQMLIEEYWWQSCPANIWIEWYFMHFTNDNIVLVFCQYLDPPMLQSEPISAVEGRCQNPERENSKIFCWILSRYSRNCTRWSTDCTFVKVVLKLCDVAWHGKGKRQFSNNSKNSSICNRKRMTKNSFLLVYWVQNSGYWFGSEDS